MNVPPKSAGFNLGWWRGQGPSRAETLLNRSKANDGGGVKAVLADKAFEDPDGELVLFCACMAARKSKDEALRVLLADDRLRDRLWRKRDLRMKIGNIDLSERGVTKTITVAEEILHALCKGGSVSTARVFFASLTRSQIARLVRKAGRIRQNSDLSSQDTSTRPSHHRATLDEVGAASEDGGSEDAGARESMIRRRGAASLRASISTSRLKQGGVEEQPHEDVPGSARGRTMRSDSSGSVSATASHVSLDSTQVGGQAFGIVGQVFEEIAQRASDERGVFEIVAASGHLDLLRYLSEQVGFDLGFRAQQTLDAAVKRASLEMVEFLLRSAPIREYARFTLAAAIASNSRAMCNLWLATEARGPLEKEKHRRLGCDMCHTVPIVGPRYKSIAELTFHYTSFDLCESCALASDWASLPEDVRGFPMLKIANSATYLALEESIEFLHLGSAERAGEGESSMSKLVDSVPKALAKASVEDDPAVGQKLAKSISSLGRSLRSLSASTAPKRPSVLRPRPSLLQRLLCKPSKPLPRVASRAQRASVRASLPAAGKSELAQGSVAISIDQADAGGDGVLEQGADGELAADGAQTEDDRATTFELFATAVESFVKSGALGAYFPPEPSVSVRQVLLVTLFRGVWKAATIERILRACDVTPSWVMQPFFLWACREDRDSALPVLKASPDLLGLTEAQAAAVAERAHNSELFYALCSSFGISDESKEFDLLFNEAKNNDRLLELLAARKVDLAKAAKRSVSRHLRQRQASYLGDAIYHKNLPLARALLEYPGVEPWNPNNDAFWSACKAGNVEFVEMFLQNEGWIRVRSDGEHEATCNSCDELIDGTRYKCSSCFDFDLCFACMRKGKAQGHNADHEETPIVALRDPVFWECPRVAIHAGHVEVVRRLFEDDRFHVFPIYFMWATRSVEMTRLLLDYCPAEIVDLDGDLVVSQASLLPDVLALFLADPRFGATDNALLTAILNGVEDSVRMLLNSGKRFEPSTFAKAMPFLFMQDIALMEIVLRSLPSEEWIDLMGLLGDVDIWLLVTVDKLDLAMRNPALAPRTREEALRFLEAAVHSGRPALVEWWLAQGGALGDLARAAACESMAVLVALASKLPSSTRHRVKKLLADSQRMAAQLEP